MYSITYSGVIIFVLGYLFNIVGVPFSPDAAEGTVSFITATVGVLLTLWGRYRAGGVKWFGGKKIGKEETVEETVDEQ